MKHRGNAGNTHAVANYMRVAPKYGHSVAIYGDAASRICRSCSSPPTSRPSTASSICSNPSSTASSGCRKWRCSATFPRQHRLIFDMDGMYNPVIQLDGYDFNHRDEAERDRWIELLSTRWPTGSCKPTIAHARQSARAAPMTFYGYDPALEVDPADGAAQAVRHPACRPQLVALAGGRRRAAAGLRADPRPDRRDRVHRPVVGQAAGGGSGRRARRRRSSRIPRAFRRLRIQTPKRRDVSPT